MKTLCWILKIKRVHGKAYLEFIQENSALFEYRHVNNIKQMQKLYCSPVYAYLSQDINKMLHLMETPSTDAQNIPDVGLNHRI